MRLPIQCVLVLTVALGTVISTTTQEEREYEVTSPECPAGPNENIPLDIPVAIRRIFFQGKSNRPFPPFPIRNELPEDVCDCQYHVTCAYQLDEIRQSCYLPSGGIGICCPPFRGGRTGEKSIFGSYYPPESMSDVPEEEVKKAAKKAKNKLKKILEKEREFCREGMTLTPGTAESNHLRVFRTLPEVRELKEKAIEYAEASTELAMSMEINGSELNVDAEKYNDTLRLNCLKMPNCPNPMSKYRTASGECNNLNNPEWGRSRTELWRLLPPRYEDGISKPRVNSVQGGKLPLVRDLSNTILLDMDKPDLRYTLSVMQWAQFMDHDLSHSPFTSLQECGEELEERAIRCCTKDNKMLANSEDLHPLCLPIEVPENDPFYSQEGRGVTCLTFIRSDTVCPFETKCRFRHIEQINTLTHWIDGSVVYGQKQTDQNDLRAFDKGLTPGLLRNSSNNFLPENANASGCVCTRGICYLAGESRVNEQPGLTMMHTLWMRQHNLIARRLYEMNPHWNDETVFQETRRIVAAQITHITYNEWLPIIIGEKFMEEFDLLPQREGFALDYDPTINANINNEFSTAAFRFGHSLVQGLIKLFRVPGSVLKTYFPDNFHAVETKLRDNFMTGRLITLPEFFDGMLRGLTRQPPQTMDNLVTEDLRNHLLQVPSSGQNFGMDLMSLNLQRGRDHGIATYNDVRELCNLGRAKKFSDITDTISPSIVEKLRGLYKHVDDIDLFVGGMAETSYWQQGGDGILGPTFSCIVGDQFVRLKRADRYYYELKGQAGQFTQEQLDQIRLTSWARIVCDNSENLDVMQPLAFRHVNHFNLLVSCLNSEDIPQIDLSPWYDEERK